MTVNKDFFYKNMHVFLLEHGIHGSLKMFLTLFDLKPLNLFLVSLLVIFFKKLYFKALKQGMAACRIVAVETM